MSPVVTLTTDFGTRDGYVGAMKGRILSVCPATCLVDITHDIQPQNILQASWTLLRSTPQFPDNSIHIAVIDPGVGSVRRPILVKSENRWYVGPDNGIFSEIIREFGTQEILEIQTKTEWWQAHSSFDGLALFAPAAAHLAAGLPTRDFCNPITRLLKIQPKSAPTIDSQGIQGRILMFDHFGNALTDISQANLNRIKGEVKTITCRNRKFDLVSHYEQGKEAKAIALVNSDGYLELAVYGSSAEKRLGLNVADDVVVR